MSFIEQLPKLSTFEPDTQLLFLEAAEAECTHFKNLLNLFSGVVDGMESNPDQLQNHTIDEDMQHWPHLVIAPMLITNIVPKEQVVTHLKSLCAALEYFIRTYETMSMDGTIDRLTFEAKQQLNEQEEPQNESLGWEY